MKKFAIAAATAVLLTAASPALALDAPTEPSFVYISPCFFDCLGGGVYDAATGSSPYSFEVNTGPFVAPSLAAEYDPVTDTAYFVTVDATPNIFAFNMGSEDGLDVLNDLTGLPTEHAEIHGLALDDSTGILHVLYFDIDANNFKVISIDRTSGDFGTPVAISDSLTAAGAIDFAITGGVMYVLTESGQIGEFSLSDGSPVGHITYPDSPEFVDAIDISQGGILRIVTDYNDVNQFWSYDLNAGSWSDAVVLDALHTGWAWYGAGSAPAPTPSLASTGFDATGLLAGAAALTAAGGAVALRRRVRR